VQDVSLAEVAIECIVPPLEEDDTPRVLNAEEIVSLEARQLRFMMLWILALLQLIL
jgi:hypothetical protein